MVLEQISRQSVLFFPANHHSAIAPYRTANANNLCSSPQQHHITHWITNRSLIYESHSWSRCEGGFLIYYDSLTKLLSLNQCFFTGVAYQWLNISNNCQPTNTSLLKQLLHYETSLGRLPNKQETEKRKTLEKLNLYTQKYMYTCFKMKLCEPRTTTVHTIVDFVQQLSSA